MSRQQSASPSVGRVADFDQQLIAALPKLMHHAMQFTRDRELARDLVQDTIVKILEHRDSYGEQSKFGGWAYMIMRNLIYNHTARLQPRLRLTMPVETVEQMLPSPAGQEARLLARDVQRLWNALPQCQTRLLEAANSGTSYEDLAAAEHLPLGTIKSRIHRARAVLAAALV